MNIASKLFLPALFALAASNLSALGISGTAVQNASPLVGGNGSFLLVDTGGDGIDFNASSLGVSLSVGSTIGNDYVAGYNEVNTGFGVSLPGNANFTIGDGGTSNNDSFYILFFDVATTSNYTTAGGENFGTLDDASWNIGANNGASLQYGSAGTLAQFSTLSLTGTVVPEPSSAAVLIGAVALGFVATRRRKA